MFDVNDWVRKLKILLVLDVEWILFVIVLLCNCCVICVNVFKWFVFVFFGVKSRNIRLMGLLFRVLKLIGLFRCVNNLMSLFRWVSLLCGMVMFWLMLVELRCLCCSSVLKILCLERFVSFVVLVVSFWIVCFLFFVLSWVMIVFLFRRLFRFIL